MTKEQAYTYIDITQCSRCKTGSGVLSDRLREDLAVLLTDIPDGTPFAFSLGGNPAVQIPLETEALGPITMELAGLEGMAAGQSGRIDDIEGVLGGSRDSALLEMIRALEGRICGLEELLKPLLEQIRDNEPDK